MWPSLPQPWEDDRCCLKVFSSRGTMKPRLFQIGLCVFKQQSIFTSSGDYEASLRQKRLSNSLFNTPKKERGGQATFVFSEVESHNMYDQAVETTQKDPFKRANPGALGEVVLGVDSGLHNLSMSFQRHVVKTQDALEGQQSAPSLLGSLGHLGGSASFRAPPFLELSRPLVLRLKRCGGRLHQSWISRPSRAKSA
jgi:hypothetical protein